MLKKNVYIMYPAGYGGSYVNWAISISDATMSANTVRDPVNNNKSEAFGSTGTSHLHVRIPTHQGIEQHLQWVLTNRPTEPRIYIINAGSNEIPRLLQHDPSGIVIHIHDNNDEAITSYGIINGATKWPTYTETLFNTTASLRHLLNNVDPYNSADSLIFRNFAVEDRNYLTPNHPINWDSFDALMKQCKIWYQVRSKRQPHEVNSSTYNIAMPDYKNQIFEFSCYDIVTNSFPAILENILKASELSDNFDCSYLKEFHSNYINAQPNTQWFKSYQQWKEHGVIDSYILSHSIIQAEILKKIFKNSNIHFFSDQEVSSWKLFYYSIRDSSWPELPQDEHGFYTLPNWVQQEIVNVFDYKLTVTSPPSKEMLELYYSGVWKKLSLDAINQIYQRQL